jgi:hypothetical protein
VAGILFDMVSNQKKRFYYLRKMGFYDHLDDKTYISKQFKVKLGRKMDWENPQSFNEKLQWLKIYDRKPIYTNMVDKYAVKQYVADKIGNEFIIPTLGVWDKFDDIDFKTLPSKFVLKCTHDSGGLLICKDKAKLDIKASRKIINKSLQNDYYLRNSREWPYKDVPHRIIAEQFMTDDKYQTEDKGLVDYKFYCFNGVPRFLYVAMGLSDHKTAQIGFLNMDWELENFGRVDFKPLSDIPSKPSRFDEMAEIAEILSRNIPFLRVDLYEINGRIYFGELTFTPCGGLMPFEPIDADYMVGEMLDIAR